MAASLPTEELCGRLRPLVQDCLAKHLYDSAIFYADKLNTLSKQAPQDAYLLAQAFYVGRQYRRALALLKDSELVEADIRCRYLAARCLAAVEDWDECLTIMGGPDPTEAELQGMQESTADAELGRELSYTGAMCLLRGQVYEAQENRARAVRWYKTALVIDPFCVEAFKALTEGHMLTSDEEASLRDSLRFRERDRWLHLLYRAKSRKHESYTMDATLAPLEAPAALLPAPAPAAAKQSAPAAVVAPLQPSASARVNSHQAADSAGMRTRSRAHRETSPGADTVMQDGVPDEDAENAGKGGCGLGGNLDVAICRADWHLHKGEHQACYALTAELIARDPYALEAMPLHLVASLELGKKNELFLRAHKLVEDYPEHAVAWFGVGCYYQSIGRFDSARQYFGKATTMDASFAPAWLGFSHAFAAQDESDQAMAAYRTAARLFPGLHDPLLGMGCEYARMNSTALAQQLLRSAHAVCPQDPQPCHELGCLFYRGGDYATAKIWLTMANEKMPRPLTAACEPTIAALGHVYRKLRMFREAAACFDTALSILPGQASTFAGLAYTYHLEDRIQDAIDNYHKALALKPEDAFVAEMLTLAMQDSARSEYAF